MPPEPRDAPQRAAPLPHCGASGVWGQVFISADVYGLKNLSIFPRNIFTREFSFPRGGLTVANLADGAHQKTHAPHPPRTLFPRRLGEPYAPSLKTHSSVMLLNLKPFTHVRNTSLTVSTASRVTSSLSGLMSSLLPALHCPFKSETPVLPHRRTAAMGRRGSGKDGQRPAPQPSSSRGDWRPQHLERASVPWGPTAPGSPPQ